jgi:hypothetical protein
MSKTIKVLKQFPVVLTKDKNFRARKTKVTKGSIILLPEDAVLVEVADE